MIDIPQKIHYKILCTLAEIDPYSLHFESEALSHGAIGLMGTIFLIWGLRPDGSFWKFDASSGLPLTPLEPECEIPALRIGTERYAWLSDLIPRRPWHTKDCSGCDGTGWAVRTGIIVLRTDGQGGVCDQCRGKGW